MCQKKCVLSRNVFCQDVSTRLSCFRTAAIVIIALSRMHFLVRRWQHRRHTGSSAVLTRGLSESTLSSFHGKYTASCCSFCFHFLYSIFPAIVASFCIFNNACNYIPCSATTPLSSAYRMGVPERGGVTKQTAV